MRAEIGWFPICTDIFRQLRHRRSSSVFFNFPLHGEIEKSTFPPGEGMAAAPPENRNSVKTYILEGENKMKHMRKLVTLVIVLAMVMAFMVPTAMAAEDLDSDPAKYTIKIKDGVDGQTYTAYKVFDVTLAAETGNETDAGFAYTISTSSQWWTLLCGTNNNQTGVYTNSTYGLTFTPSASDNTVYVITNTMNETQAAALAAYLRTNISNKTAAGSVVYSNSNTTIDVTASGMGYYFVDTTVGTLCSLDTTNQDVTINEKNTAPTMNSKTVIDRKDVCIGEEKIFTIEFTAGKGAENYILHDSMEAGFNAASDFGVTYKDGQNEAVTAETSTYTVITENITDGCSFHIAFADAAMVAGRKVTVTYKTSLNANAEIFDGNLNGQTVNQNTAWLSYGENENLTTPQKSAYLYTYAFAFNKTDGEGNPLSGAKFTLTEWDGTSHNPVYFTKDANSAVYTYAGNVAAEGLISEVVSPDNGIIILKGVKDTYYTVLETEAPDGYNILATTISIRPTNDWTSAPTTNHYISYENNVATEVENSTGLNTKQVSTGNTPTLMLNIINLTGTELPSTGGMGTTIFYILGSLMVVGAAVVLVTNKRMRGQM